MHSYPTPQHKRAAVEITSFFEAHDTQAVLLTNSCARGRQLYEKLPSLFEIHRLESRELEQKAQDLRALVDAYVA